MSAHAASIFDAKRLLDELCVVAAMDIEGYAANPSPYNPLCATVRPTKDIGRPWNILITPRL